MGGINHAPCGRYLRNSTMISRGLSSAYASLEQSNIAFEDLILAELDGGQFRRPTKVCEHLASSKTQILLAISVCELLRAQMEQENYTDLPAKKQINMSALGKRLSENGIVSEASWEAVSGIMKGGSFYDLLEVIKSRLIDLGEKTDLLATKFKQFCSREHLTLLTAVMEQNLPGNVKVEFAQLYSSWANFHQLFLASSMFSTEVWYAEKGYGSLTATPAASKVA